MSEHYFISSDGKLCCYVDGVLCIVNGVMQSGNYLHFTHKAVRVNK